MPNLVFCVNRTRAHFGLDPVSPDTVLGCVGLSERDFVRGGITEETVAERGEAFFEEAYRFYKSFYKEHATYLTGPYAGITAALDTLRARELRLGIVSNKAHEFVTEMAEMLFPGRFSAVVGVGELSPKPDPAPAIEAARMMGVQPRRCAFVGDSEIDMETAKNAGMIPLGVAWGYRPPMLLRHAGAVAIADAPNDLATLIGLCEKGLLL